MKSNLNCLLKALYREGILCKRPGALEKYRKLVNWGYHLYTQEGEKKQYNNFRGISLLSLPAKVHTKFLEKWCCEIIKHCLLEKLGVCQRCLHLFCRPRESAFQIPWEKFWRVLQQYGVDGRLLLAVTSLYSCSELWSLCPRRRSSQPFTVCVGLKQVCVQSPIISTIYLYELDRQSQPSRRVCYWWKLEDHPWGFRGRISTACILWIEHSTHTRSVCTCVRSFAWNES